MPNVNILLSRHQIHLNTYIFVFGIYESSKDYKTNEKSSKIGTNKRKYKLYIYTSI